jgi:hypothetical protein
VATGQAIGVQEPVRTGLRYCVPLAARALSVRALSWEL